jgi:hypothetical protein
MPQHVGMDSKRHFGGRAKPRQHPAKGNCGHRSAALAHEDISSGFLFALETAQGAPLAAVLQSGLAVHQPRARCRLTTARGWSQDLRRAYSFALLGQAPRHIFKRPKMSTEDDREKSREESPKWHRARAARLRANGFAKMAEEHEQIAEIIERRRREQENK